MIVALEHMWCQYTGGIAMKEVETEEEAFYEMRNFLRINNIESDTTTINMIEEEEHAGRIIPKHKEVHMSLYGCLPSGMEPNPCFGIYYGSDKPKYMELKSFEEHKPTAKGIHYIKTTMDEGGYPRLISDYYLDDNKWYAPLLKYLKSSEPEKWRDKECH